MSSLTEKDAKMATLLQMRGLLELTTQITKRCFDACVTRINPQLDKSEESCLVNCAANSLQLKLLVTSHIVKSVQNQKSEA